MLDRYFQDVFNTTKTGDATEESYYPDIKRLFENWGKKKGKNFFITPLPKRTEAGNPDFRIWDGDQHIIGYIEARLVHISSPYTGRLIELPVERGAQVKAGQHLFSLDPMPESAELKAIIGQAKRAAAQLANVQKGRRPSEVEAIEAQIDGTEANIEFLNKELNRRRELVRTSALEKEALDQTIRNIAVSKSQFKNFKENLITAKLPSRIDEVRAAEYQLESLQYIVERFKWALGEKSMSSPDNARVFDTFYRVGEYVPANRPVLSLLIDKEINHS